MRLRTLFPLVSVLAMSLPLAARAADDNASPGDWTGTGEVGLALARGNSKSESLNAKLNFKKEDAVWKDNFYLTALRNKGEVKVSKVVDGQTVSADEYQATANRFEAGASAGYKLSPRDYVIGALRYEKDDFAAFQWQAAVSIGYGYIAIKNPDTELSFEIGPGYKRVQPVDTLVISGDPPVATTVTPSSQGELIGRGLMNFSHKLNDSTSIEDKLLVEAGSDGQFVQNDIGLVVKMNDKLALKVAHQLRYNGKIAPGSKHSDQLLTTNLVYSF